MDKQIIIDDQKKTIHRLQQECTEKTNTILALGDKLKCKEQECEELKDEILHLRKEGNKSCAYCIDLIEKEKQLDQAIAQREAFWAMYRTKHGDLADKYEELKKCYKNNLALLDFEETNTTKLVNKVMKLEKTLTEIKPTLEFYANSTIGEEQEDGTYRIELSHKYGSSNMYGAPCYYKYNPKLARQALQKIKECEVKNEQ